MVFVAQLATGIGVTFLSLNKKVTKEISIGEALTAKPVAAALVNIHLTPASSRFVVV